MTAPIILNARIEDQKKELNCPFDFRCLTQNIAWEENLTPFATIDSIQCLFNSKQCENRYHHGYTYLCKCPMMQSILDHRRTHPTK